MTMLKAVIQTVDKDGNPVELAVKPPSAQAKQDARLYHAREYSRAVKAGAFIREELEEHLRKSRLWDDDREAEFQRLRRVLLDGERTIAKGGMRLKEARQLAIDMSKSRKELQQLLSQRNSVDANTADAMADQAQFNYSVAYCTVYNETGKPYFTKDGEHPSVEDYIERGTEQAAVDAATKLSEILFGTERDVLAKLPENQFLKRFRFVDDEFHLIDDRGRRVDDRGRLVDEEGRFVDEDGNYVDADGNRVDEDGRYVVDEQPFLDDDGNPIFEDSPAPEPSGDAPEPPGDGEGSPEA